LARNWLPKNNRGYNPLIAIGIPMPERTIPCPNCGKMTIIINEIPSTTVYRRGFTDKKSFQFKRGSTLVLTKVCPECGVKYGRTDDTKTREQFLERMRKSGLPTKIETVHK
jgi:predicted RNA-binding Zn-ribbon protein involved in translation (DUF1610 family)